jgi:hypothetical protein
MGSSVGAGDTLPGQDHVVAEPSLIVRVGTFYFAISDEADVGEMFSAICRELKKDNRVIDVEQPEALPSWDNRGSFHPVTTTDHMDIVLGLDRATYAQSVRPVTFRVRVPVKNQPLFRGEDDIPAEDYQAIWDGITLAVSWEQPQDKDVPHSGGHVLEPILRAANEGAGGDLHVQPCSLGCEFMFFHTTIRMVPYSGADDWEFTEGGDPSVVQIEGPPGQDLKSWLPPMFAVVRPSAGAFAEMKNLGARIQAAEGQARSTLGRLLAATAQREHLATHSVLLTLRKRWDMRGFRGRARQDLAILWLTIANLEMLKRRWSESRLRFEQGLKETAGIAFLFDRDDSPEAETVETLNLSTIQSAVSHLSGTLDTKSIAIATIVGATAGGLMGALVG